MWFNFGAPFSLVIRVIGANYPPIVLQWIKKSRRCYRTNNIQQQPAEAKKKLIKWLFGEQTKKDADACKPWDIEYRLLTAASHQARVRQSPALGKRRRRLGFLKFAE